MQDNKQKSSSGDNLEYLFKEAERLVQSDSQDDQIMGASVLKWLTEYGSKLSNAMQDNPKAVAEIQIAVNRLKAYIEKI